MNKPRSLTGVIRLPDASLNFHLSFDGKGGKTEAVGVGNPAETLGSILEKAIDLSPEIQELLITFADYIRKVAEKGNGGHEG